MPSRYNGFNNLSIGMQIVDEEMRYYFLNDSLLKQIQMEREQIIGKAMVDVFPGIENTEIFKSIQTCFATSENQFVINEFEYPDGSRKVYKLDLERVEEGVLILSTDISATKEYDVFLKNENVVLKDNTKKLQNLLRKVLDSSLNGVQYFRSIRNSNHEIIDFEYVFSNKVASEIIQIEEKDVIGKRLLEVLPGHKDILEGYGKSLFELYAEVVESGQNKSLLFKFTSDGIDAWFSNNSVKLEDGFVVTFSVVTELVNKTSQLEEINKNLEEKVRNAIREQHIKEEALIQQSKLAAMGDMISAIAHQWRQPLTSISYGIMTLNEIFTNLPFHVEESEKVEYEEVYTQIEKEIEFLTQTIEDFRKFYSPNSKNENFSVTDVIHSSFHFLDHEIKINNIRKEINLPIDSTITAYGNPNQLRQVFLILIDNSIDSFKNKEIEDKTISFSVTHFDSEFIEIEVSDNAGGIPQELVHKIFEPYFTTKGPTSGTGMGLYISKLIIEKTFEGSIRASNEKNGAKFILRIKNGER
ncbi:PAS domain-containing sensor histidine kinase [Leptospira jelokensis]|uniref:histidine kinase n=1 Tax=Leptospira jelokensis TaxID=2484931 RepID=A0A4Z0ZPA6_9LEPT|nr:PAS domain-containing sensor histidine kinase [Leptospira jelokensis]TGL57776.1 PAS domain-containing sensor histidine kinase [Leptospira jelokensis]